MPPLQAKLEQFFAIPAMAFAAGGDHYSAELLAKRGPMVAEAWYELSRENKSVKRILEGLVEGSAWGAVIFSTLSLVVPIAKHKGLYRGPDPFAFMGLPVPDAQPSTRSQRGMTWSKAPSGPAPSPFSGGFDPDENTPPGDDGSISGIVQYLDGAPPGVVTVAASAASHNGAR